MSLEYGRNVIPHPTARRFREAAERLDPDGLTATLDPNVILHSPVSHRPYSGKATVGALLRLVSETFEFWRCSEEIVTESDLWGFVFKSRVDDRELEGIDLLRVGPSGLIIELTVMIRPLSGLILFGQILGQKTQAAGLEA